MTLNSNTDIYYDYNGVFNDLDFDWTAEQSSEPIDESFNSCFDDAFGLPSTFSDEPHVRCQASDGSDTDLISQSNWSDMPVSIENTQSLDSLSATLSHSGTSLGDSEELQMQVFLDFRNNEYSSELMSPGNKSQSSLHPHSAKSYDPPTTKVQSSPEQRAHGFEHMINIFEGTPHNQLSRKSRKAFEKSRRQEVALMRKVKPCTRCRTRKVSCKFPGPCEPCKKAAGSVTLARHICIRQSLTDLRYGSFDLLYQSFNEEWLQEEICNSYGPQWEANCTLFCDKRKSSTYNLPLTVQSYSTPKQETGPYQVPTLDGFNQSGPVWGKTLVYRVAIVPDSIPTVEDLLKWVTIKERGTRLINILATFIETYCEHLPELPLRGLLTQSLNVLKLLRCWRGVVAINTDSAAGSTMFISSAVSSQLLIVIKKGICAAEFSILETLETLLYGVRGPGQQNSLALWACLWPLILTYRDCVTTYKLYSKPDSRTQLQSPLLIAASQHMYDVLTSLYAALFRSSTPLYLDWRKEENFSLLGKSQKLKSRFCDLCTAIFWFYYNRDGMDVEDKLLRHMIIDQERKLKPRYPRTTRELRQLYASTHQ